jgi:hypothetical protein
MVSAMGPVMSVRSTVVTLGTCGVAAVHRTVTAVGCSMTVMHRGVV